MNDDAELNLRELSVPTLIKVIFADVKSGADFYRETPAHELAELLGIDDADNPGTGRDWQFIRYVCREPLAEHINGGAGSEILDCLEANVNPERLTVIRELGKTLDETYSLEHFPRTRSRGGFPFLFSRASLRFKQQDRGGAWGGRILETCGSG
jgi:hypothetical protein